MLDFKIKLLLLTDEDFLLLIDGPTGAGKSTTAEIVHTKFNRTALLGMDRIKWSISGFKRDHRNNVMINNVVLAMTKEFLAQNINVIVEQGFRDKWAEMYQKLGEELGVKTITIQLTTSKSILLKRINKRNKKPHPKDIPRVPTSRVLKNIQRHNDKTPIQAVVISTSENDSDRVADQVIELIQTNP